MQSTTLLLVLVACITSTAKVNSAQLGARQNCGSNYSKCSPSGATSTNIPAVGGALSGLYVDVLDSINGVKFSRRGALDLAGPIGIRSSSATVCCADGTTCLTLANINAPFCYDHFTTNFYLSDGSYGTLTTGAYTASDSTSVNLLTGNYTSPNGSPGNIYSARSDAPNTATLTLPTPYTSAGVGTAIPASQLGGEATYTTTIPGTTVPPSTVPAQTVTVTSSVGGSTVVVATTQPASTIPGTTVPPITETITKAVAATGGAKQGAANNVFPRDAAVVAGAGFGLVLLAVLGL